ncbi:MAG: ABC transporter substrate-binding protein [Candidatus Binatia bacterium]
MIQIKIGIGVSSVGRFLPVVGKEAGLFEKQGISVDIVNQQDEDKVVVDIGTGKTPIGTPNAPSLLFSLLKGNDLVIVGGVLNRPGFYLTAKQTIHGVADLKGKIIGINQPRRMAGVVMLALLRQWGLDPKKDLTLIELGVNDKSLEALQQGKIDAALLPPEKAFLAEEEGFNLLANSLNLNCQWVPLATTRRFLLSNRDLVRKIANIYIESIRHFKSEPEMTLRVIRRCLPGLAEKPQVLEKIYRFFAGQFEPTLMPSMNSLSAILDEVAHQDSKFAEIQTASLVENLFLTTPTHTMDLG